MLLQDVLAYSEKENVLGTVVEYSRVKGTATLKREEELYVVDANEIIIMKKIGEMNNTEIYENDIFKGVGSEVHYIIGLDESEQITMSIVDKRLNAVRLVETFPAEELKKYSHALELQENYFALKNRLPTVDFNIETIRVHDKDGVTYYYIGNNREEETLDVIKVIFMGSKVLEEETYERFTVSYDEYADKMNSGEWVKVRPQEISNYIYGAAHEREVQPQKKEIVQEIHVEENTEKYKAKCATCKRTYKKCSCMLFD